MWELSWMQQALLFVHLVAFGVAVSAILREDLRLLGGRGVNVWSLTATARLVSWTLALLWATGLAMIGCDYLRDPGSFRIGSKLAAKLLVVIVLSANGVALHMLVFPTLARGVRPLRGDPGGLPLVLGVVSTTSWLYASFVGSSRLVAARMSLPDFVLLYVALLAAGVAGAFVLLRPRLARLDGRSRRTTA